MKRYLYVLLPLLIVTALTAVSCSDDSNNSSAKQQDSAGMLTALNIIDNVGFHEIDEELNQPGGGTIDPSWLGKVRHAQIAVASVEWPGALRDRAGAFLEAAERLATTLDADDAKAGAGPAKDGHETSHDLTTDGWNVLATRAGIQLPDAEETPQASPAGR